MHRKYVQSSNLLTVGYDEVALILEVQFRNGGVYQYDGVPLAEYKALMTAESKGSYFDRHIRNKYNYRKRQ
jgi:hypothetical protein